MASQVPVGPGPTQITCPSCRAVVVSRTDNQSNTKTHIIAVLLCLSVICCPCVCVPYCTDSCQDTTHNCPNCNAYLGKYAR